MEQRLEATEALDMIASSPKNSKRRNVSGKTQEGGVYTEYGSDADGEKGYARKTFSNGDQGYKNYDTFHKKRGDSYGFEEHEAFGDGQGKHKDATKAASNKHAKHKDHVVAGSSAESYYAGEDSSGGGAEYYSGEGGSGEASGYSEGDSYSESGGDGSAEGYSSGESYSGEDSSDY
ncbi:hypothetical protein QAD02_009571 [Eretmocerus hayati]|uniref:Uncharacterized protein n=1 Tax=Eretmocerus hayati TaxID=131215 RepID=A0ACC2NAZ3_9HYME|nr:hypothetical protein QAD02_009571 [Eretmocerus hayati]